MLNSVAGISYLQYTIYEYGNKSVGGRTMSPRQGFLTPLGVPFYCMDGGVGLPGRTSIAWLKDKTQCKDGTGLEHYGRGHATCMVSV